MFLVKADQPTKMDQGDIFAFINMYALVYFYFPTLNGLPV